MANHAIVGNQPNKTRLQIRRVMQAAHPPRTAQMDYTVAGSKAKRARWQRTNTEPRDLSTVRPANAEVGVGLRHRFTRPSREITKAKSRKRARVIG